MNILYLLIIKPIETVLGFLFRAYVQLTGSYGLSIILLSLSVTIIMFPLFYIAEVWKRKEQEVEKRMKRRLSYIKKYYTGQKRYCMIKATHKFEGYTAASSFRTSFGLLIQIPFFFAAYHLLSHYEPYRGVGWLFIRDFALPDGLLWGVNLLPVLMTVINIVSSSIYMRGSRARDIVELYVMAGVFLLLLYASPAALVLYWTMNNVFSVGKSLIFLRLFPHEKYVPDPEDKTFKDYVRDFSEAIKPCLTPDFYAFVVAILLFGLQCRFLQIHKDSFGKPVFLAAVFADIIIYFCLDIFFSRCFVKKNCRPPIAVQKLDSLYYWNILFLALSVTILWPVLVFLSSPAETETSIWSIFRSNIPVFAVMGLLSFVCFRWAGRETRSRLAAFVLFLSIVAVLYHYILPCDYGELDKVVLGLEKKLDNKSIFPWIADIAVLISSMLLAKVCVQKYPVQSRNAVALVLVCFVGMTGAQLGKYLGSRDAEVADSSVLSDLPKINEELNGYSRNGKNIVLFIADQFCGGYMENILKEHPGYNKAYSGFTWYKNAISLANHTCGSVPSLFAGDDYSPEKLNRMEGNGYKKIRESSKMMFDSFISAKYKVSILGGESSYMSPSWYRRICYSEKTPYGNYYRENYMSDEQAEAVSPGPLFIMLSLFQNSPYFLKPVIYNDAGWFIFSKKAQYRTIEGTVRKEYGFMKLLPLVSNADEKGNTFKFMHSMLTHRPWCFKKDGSVVKPGEFADEEAESFMTGDAAYYCCSAFIALFAEYINWLKANGVYDNTCIILISDHGNDYPEHNPYMDKRDLNRLNSLIMIKPFGSGGDLKTDSDTLISLQDIPVFLKNAKDGSPVVIPKERKLYPVYFTNLQGFLNTGHLDITHKYEVSDNIYDEKNWKEIR